MKQFVRLFPPVMILMFVGLISCGGASGGSEFGNPTRVVKGRLTTTSLAQNMPLFFLVPHAIASEACPADTVIATDSQGETTTVTVEGGCSFSLNLNVNKAYSLSFVLADEFVATLFVQNGRTALKSSVFVLSDGKIGIDLGDVIISDGEADPESDPAEQNDADDDGVSDYDDSDDDGDDVTDDDEGDCDLDGYDDGYDEDDAACDTGDDNAVAATIVDVYPENKASFIAFDEPVDVLFDCEIDTATVSQGSFSVVADADTIDCLYTFSESDTLASCGHDEQEFLPATTYTATIDGVTCVDGTEIASESWSWSTAEEE